MSIRRLQLPFLALSLYANFALANRSFRPAPERYALLEGAVRYGGFVARQVSVDGGTDCTEESSCSECYGSGYVLCDNAGCFDPSQGQECCKGGDYCIGTDCCGSSGPGSTGTDGVVPQSAYSAFFSATTQWPCFPTDTNEECCHRGGNDIQWCGGDFPSQVCYNTASATCCGNGEACTGNGCCSSYGAVATTRDLTSGQATHTGSAMVSSTPLSHTITTPPSISTLTAAAATPTTTSSSNAGSGLGAVKGAVGLLGAFLAGLAFL